MNDANHIGDLNEMVVGDNDHGDAIPEPKCGVCGIPWVSHMGIMGVCLCNRALKEDLKELRHECDEANKRIRRLLGDTEQLELTAARLTEDLRRMDAITNILYASIEKRKLRGEGTS